MRAVDFTDLRRITLAETAQNGSPDRVSTIGVHAVVESVDMHDPILIPMVGLIRSLRALSLGGLFVALLTFVVNPSTSTAAVSDFNETRALGLMKSAKAESRAIAYRACRQLGTGGTSTYRSLLTSAHQHHVETIENAIGLASEEANRFSASLRNLQEQRTFTLKFTLADLKKDAGRLEDLRRAHADSLLWYKEACAQHGRATASMGAVNASATAVDEIKRELAYCANRKFAIGPRTFDRVLSKYSSYASNLHDRLAELTAFQRELQQQQIAMKHNRAQTWATLEMRAFADLLNERRQNLGLTQLKLETRLSEACTKHAQEMVALKYFAHHSPVVENATPEIRARNARYRGTFVGENIFFYASGQDARTAFDAWWKSDGHRFVMFDPKPDQLGLSNKPVTHWNLMTGSAAEKTQIRSTSTR